MKKMSMLRNVLNSIFIDETNGGFRKTNLQFAVIAAGICFSRVLITKDQFMEK